jgi:hypothetical protein
MPTPSLPRSLADLLAAFGPCFTQPTFRTFQALVAGFLTSRASAPSPGCWSAPGWPAGATTTWPTGSLRPPAGRLTSSD